MPRQFKYSEAQLTSKDMSVVREAAQAKVQRDKRHGALRDYSLQHRIELRWDLNAEAERDQMCELIFDGQRAIIDAEEFQRLLRWV